MEVHTGSTGALPKDGDSVGITPELGNIILHPPQCHHLVLQTVVAGNSNFTETQESCLVWYRAKVCIKA
jgi:hypothetical protein